MKAIKAVFLQFFRQQIRDRYAIFWSLVFPLVLMTILVLVFGGFEDGDSLQIQISLVNFAENNGENDFSGIIKEVFENMESGEEQSWLNLHLPDREQTKEDFLTAEKDLLEQGQRHAVLVLPSGLNINIQEKIRFQFMSAGDAPEPGKLTVYRNSADRFSKMAANIISGVISDINREINVRSGLIDSGELINLNRHQIETIGNGREFRMVDYLLPGIILMTLLMSGMEIFVEKISSFRDRGILRRYFATPLRPGQYFAGIFSFIIVLALIQIVLIYIWGRLFFNFELNIFTLQSILYMIYSLVVFLSLGFLVLSFANSPESAGAMTQGLIFPLMFLGGLFFPVMGLPGIIRWIVLINPVTYLINGLRDTLGVYPSPTSFHLNIGIPALWLIGGSLIAVKFFRWNPGGEK